MTTYQLRRYEMKTELFDEFLTWFAAGIPQIRKDFDFTVEHSFVDREGAEFTWLVSYPGSRSDFTEAEGRYSASDASKAHGAKAPDAIAAMHVSFVEVV